MRNTLLRRRERARRVGRPQSQPVELGRRMLFPGGCLELPEDRARALRDAAGNESVVPFGIQIDNVAPQAVVTAPAERPVVRVGTPVAFAAEASDPGLEDVLTYAWRFGDGSGETRASLNRSDATTHAYSAPCTCTAALDVSDDDGGAARTRATEVVVFDPAAGKLTDGAKFVADSNSIGMPAGSVHALNATVQYDTGATVPKGMVDFEAAFTGVRVRSTSLRFLVITATEAIVEGAATLNGSAGYGFLLRVALAPDGRATGMNMDVWRPGVTHPPRRTSAHPGGSRSG